MRAADADILMVPGWQNSGPDHWQSRWQEKLSTARRVEQDDWEQPVLSHWADRLVSEVNTSTRPVVLVAHSLGVPTVVHAAPRFTPGKVAGAFLVAPPAPAFLASAGSIDPAFAAMPEAPLPFTTVLTVSSNDEFCEHDEAVRLGTLWGAEIAQAGEAGHINGASGHGPWPEGILRFAGFISRL
ncbi:alpha/beta hydrolase [Agaricicola taiwanensis]|uniref:Alpha/beta hydrolase n=1 Tax=Agaricicola taiwanensis TaxID=591372 RepID=A0A8J2VVF3_9RHOB|nr:alpha/beta hydrolase [Agaricicola taiwanensis]GGE40790.1 alpha/beta hydrolase [Agaricicola taiwanensis]